MRPGAVAPVILLALTSAAAASARPALYGLRLEGGAEFDSNPTRSESLEGGADPRPTLPSAAVRVAAAGDLEYRPGERLHLSLGGGLAVRRLMRPEAAGEDLLVAEARAALSYALSDSYMLGIAGAYYDVDQRADTLEDARDFRSLSPGLRLYGPLGEGRVALGAGWRRFDFKPAPELDFAGPTASLSYRRLFAPAVDDPAAAEWDFGLGATLEDRRFPDAPCMASEDCATRRQDRFVTLDADLTRTADQLVGGGLSLQGNTSNRTGEGLFRLLAHVRLVLLLPLDFSLAARAELVATRYADQVPVGHTPNGAFVTIEDEGRSSLRLDLSHPLDDASKLEAGIRYVYYTQTPGTAVVRFQRHVAVLYLALPIGR